MLTAHVNAPWPTAKLGNLKIRESLLELEQLKDQTPVARIDGEDVSHGEDRKVELPWSLFE